MKKRLMFIFCIVVVLLLLASGCTTPPEIKRIDSLTNYDYTDLKENLNYSSFHEIEERLNSMEAPVGWKMGVIIKIYTTGTGHGAAGVFTKDGYSVIGDGILKTWIPLYLDPGDLVMLKENLREIELGKDVKIVKKYFQFGNSDE